MTAEDRRKFRARIESAGGGGAFVRVPFDVEKVFRQKRVKVRTLIEGEEYRGSLVRMGGSYHILGILKEIRAKVGRDVGDEVEVVVWEDTEPRAVEVPPDLAKALKKVPAAAAAFEKLSFSRREEYARSVAEAKRPETRQARIEKVVRELWR